MGQQTTTDRKIRICITENAPRVYFDPSRCDVTYWNSPIEYISFHLYSVRKRWEWHANETRFWRCNRWRPTPKNTIFLFAFFLLQANYRIRRWSQPPFANHWMSAVRVGGNCGLGFLNDLNRGGVYISYIPRIVSLVIIHTAEKWRVCIYTCSSQRSADGPFAAASLNIKQTNPNFQCTFPKKRKIKGPSVFSFFSSSEFSRQQLGKDSMFYILGVYSNCNFVWIFSSSPFFLSLFIVCCYV